MNEALTIGGGAAGIAAFILAIVKILSQDRIWKDLIAEIRSDLHQCREDKGRLETKVDSLEGEVMTLRREVHKDYWLGITPETRSRREGGE